LAFLGIFGNYDKPGPGVSKDEPPKSAPVRFFEILGRKFGKLVQLNLIFLIPFIVAVALMVVISFSPIHFVLQLPVGEGAIQLDVWFLYVVPLPVILLSPFTAGLTYVTRNFAREEHAFVWSDFWENVKGNWKYFLMNGALVYLVYVVLSFSILYYYNATSRGWFYYIPFWVCLVLGVFFLFAQYYLPVMFVTFDLKFGQAYRNAFIFSLAGLGRNILITAVLGALLYLVVYVIPLNGLVIMILLLLTLFLLFSLISYFINFTVYPVVERYLIKPYEKKMEEEKNGGKTEAALQEDPEAVRFYAQPEEDEDEDDDEDKMVYVNGRLIKKSELKSKNLDE
jgi:uncharacterized membrane protein YesL